MFMQTPLAMRCKQFVLDPKFLHDLHNGQVSTEGKYLRKMPQIVTNGGLWGDFTIIF
jgi:hypothetical protein